MTNVFAERYANSYDDLYSDKDYNHECDVIEDAQRAWGDRAVHAILDLGCGTGSHAIPLAQRGYEVVGVDRSEAMLAGAREKAKLAGVEDRVSWSLGDVRDVRLERRFDTALLMFAVLGYQIRNQDVLAALQTARVHLEDGGLLLFDVWYGPAVLKLRPSDRVKRINTDTAEILRVTWGTLNTLRNVCRVDYLLWQRVGNELASQTEEGHDMRYFFATELELFLSLSGFTLLKMSAFPDVTRPLDETTWNTLVIAKATGAPTC